MQKSVIIVGGGISGLAAGCYSQMNNYKTSIFEMHNIPGGLCTAWKRKGYTFDISMHMLTGSVSGPFHTMWKELGVIDNFEFYFHEVISQIEGMGEKLTYSTSRESVLKQLISISPEDEKLIKEFVDLIFGRDIMKAASLNPANLKGFAEKMKAIPVILPLIPTLMKYNKVTIQEFASRFKNPFLRQAIRFFIDSPGWPMLQFPMVALAGFIKSSVKESGVPLGGSMKVMLHLANQFKNAGGDIHYNSKVKELIIENNQVVGIRLESGEEHRADYVIWAADGHTLIYDILDGKYMDDNIQKMYENWMPVKPMVHVMMGVNRDFSKEPHRLVFELEEPFNIAGKEHRWMSVIHHCFDKSRAPEGKSVVEVWFATEFDYWEKLAENRQAYEAEKKRIADFVIQQLDKRWDGFTSHVEVVDVPTPYTYKRYTGNWQGSPDGWYVTPEYMNHIEPLRALPGLDGLYLSGQWTVPFAGTVMSALTGRQAIQLMCKKEGKEFSESANIKS